MNALGSPLAHSHFCIPTFCSLSSELIPGIQLRAKCGEEKKWITLNHNALSQGGISLTSFKSGQFLKSVLFEGLERKPMVNFKFMSLVLRSINELAPQHLWEVVAWNSQFPSYRLRNTVLNLMLPKTTSKNGHRCFLYRGAKLWNSPSAESKQTFSLFRFKKTI